MATGIAQDRSLIDPRLGFTTDDKSATAVVGLGDDVPDGATLTVAWYRLSGVNGRAHLFSHKIVVGPGGLAHSQGMAQKGLAPGVYETVARMGESQVRAPWVVRVAAEPQSHVSGTVELFSLVRQTTSPLQDWEVPSSGESGWDGDLPPVSPGSPPDTCTIVGFHPGLVPLTDVTASAFALGPCTELALDATVAGPPVRIGSMEPGHAFLSVYGQEDVCSLPGGKDLPGTVVRFEVSGSASETLDFTLPDLGPLLITGMESEPEAGTRVGEGDRIRLHALALLMSPALGIEVLYVDDGSDLIGSVGNISGVDEPVPCDYGRNIADFVGEYVVPADPPPVIQICANAGGFDGTKAKDCISFYTGEVWTGTYSGTVTWDCGAGNTGTTLIEGTFRVVVEEDGAATLDGTNTATGSCGGPEGRADTPISVTGERTSAGLVFPSWFGTGRTVTIEVSGQTGQGTFSGTVPGAGGGGDGAVQLTFQATCSSCGG